MSSTLSSLFSYFSDANRYTIRAIEIKESKRLLSDLVEETEIEKMSVPIDFVSPEESSTNDSNESGSTETSSESPELNYVNKAVDMWPWKNLDLACQPLQAFAAAEVHIFFLTLL